LQAEKVARVNADRIELWGGFECTVNRVGDEHFDQLRRSGHDERVEDLELLPSLGIRTVRYPVLWERVERDGWSWADERLGRLRELGIQPIVGLVHHGSGPLRTNLLDPAFATGLAEFAAAVATRYPWVEFWTPVNEPNTTARFSCLYGLWHPHERDGRAYGHAVVNQCRATVLAMDAIRSVNPHAQLVQTDDLMKTHGTEFLRYQVDHENERRWLAYDLLTGTLSPQHQQWQWFEELGFPVDDLAWFREHPCPPDIFGFNHYLSGERFIDHRIDRYEPEVVGGNYVHRYADVLAARVLGAGADGPEVLLREAWERYGRPIAVTECHNGCTREEQLRWLDRVWVAARELRGDGVDIRAVTVWSLLGAYGWNKMVCDGLDWYEPGVFDVRSGRPRPTALAPMARSLANRGTHDHPLVADPGWWERPERLRYPPAGEIAPARAATGPPLLITGATGTLGRAFARACDERGLRYRLTTRQELDLVDPESIASALETTAPWAVVNAAGYVRVDDAEVEEERCFRENAEGAGVLAAACGERALPLVTFSSDLVFDGTAGRPYVESDPPSPLNVYGHSKAQAERLALTACAGALVVRTSAFFGPWDEHNFVAHALAALEADRQFEAVGDVVVSPTYVPDLVHETLDLLIDRERGIWHLAGADAVSWYELARLAAEAAELDPAPLVRISAGLAGWVAPRPRAAPLASERGGSLPPLVDSLPRYLEAVSARTPRGPRVRS
jgi:dTDP-4-dehydrorhamnose reductase